MLEIFYFVVASMVHCECQLPLIVVFPLTVDLLGLAATAFPVAVNVTGLPLNVEEVTVTVLVPAALPSVSVVWTRPFTSETELVPESDPPPPVIAHVTVVP